MHAKVTEFANLLYYEFVGRRTTRDAASLSNRLYPTEAGKKSKNSFFSEGVCKISGQLPPGFAITVLMLGYSRKI